VDKIRSHPFFYGVDWDLIREIDAPFVPHLRSITDTSYFPTEDLENVPEHPVGADTSGTKDLAFLGYAYTLLQSDAVDKRHILGTPSNDSAYRRRIFERNKGWTRSHHLAYTGLGFRFHGLYRAKFELFLPPSPLSSLGPMSNNTAPPVGAVWTAPHPSCASDRLHLPMIKPCWKECFDYVLAQWLILGLGVSILLAWAFPGVGKNGGAIRAEITIKWVGVGG